MRVAIYTPYLDTVGGGEKYMLTIAEVFNDEHQVDILLDAHLQKLDIEVIKEKIEKIHGFKTSKVNFIVSPFGGNDSLITRFLFFKKYDLVFYNCDGSFFHSSAKKNILHFQMPLEKISNTWMDKLK